MAKWSEFTFPSTDGSYTCHAEMWEPENTEPVAILQIVHGMIEYVRRYEDFANFLTTKGFIVVGEDHLGHGYTAKPEDRGYFTKERPWDVLIDNVEAVRKIMVEKYPNLPYCILGHSMGSFMFRKYIAKYGKNIDAAIVMGTGVMPGIVTSVGVGLTNVQKLFFGDRHVSKLIGNIAFGAYNKKIENPKSPNAWLSVNEANVVKYDADPLCTFPFTLNAYRALFKMLGFVCKKKNVALTPSELPILVIAGDADPVGNYGAGPRAAAKMYQDAGVKDVSLKLYEGLRHEILNEDCRENIYNDIYEWLSARINVNK